MNGQMWVDEEAILQPDLHRAIIACSNSLRVELSTGEAGTRKNRDYDLYYPGER